MKLYQAIYDWCFRYYGSTRSSALMRILLALIISYRFGWGGGANSLPDHGLPLAVVFYVTVLAMALGLFSKISTLFVGCMTVGVYYYFTVVKYKYDWDHHHIYILAFAAVLLSFAPCGKSYSVDRWLANRRADKAGRPHQHEEGNLYAVRLLAIQMAVLYFFAFWDKFFISGTNEIFVNFLNGTRLEQIILFHYWGSAFNLTPAINIIAGLASSSVAILEFFLPLILIQRFQKWLVIPGLLLHFSFYVLLPLKTYSLTCIVLYLAIINANRIHAFIDALGPGGGQTDGDKVTPAHITAPPTP